MKKSKKLFWKMVKEIEGCSDTTITNDLGVMTERGMQLSNDCSVMFGLDDSVLRLYNRHHKCVYSFTEKSKELPLLKELFQLV